MQQRRLHAAYRGILQALQAGMAASDCEGCPEGCAATEKLAVQSLLQEVQTLQAHSKAHVTGQEQCDEGAADLATSQATHAGDLEHDARLLAAQHFAAEQLLLLDAAFELLSTVERAVVTLESNS